MGMARKEALVTIRLAAQLLGMSRQRVHILVQEKRIPAKRIGYEYLIDKADVLAFDAERKKQP
jgi:excisionase family DNA binding protein